MFSNILDHVSNHILNFHPCLPIERDMVPFVFTVICCLFWSLEYGMLVGVLINALFILGKSMTPQFQLESQKVRLNMP